MKNKEYILCAAYLRKVPREHNCNYYNNDINKIELGYRHHDILIRFRGEVDVHKSGFYTSTGRFVNRTEAMKIAYYAGQVDYSKAIDSDKNWCKLYSEDLY